MASPRTRWLVWIVYTALWTLALVSPFSEEADRAADELLFGRKYIVAKSLHVAAYAGLTILSAWLRVPFRFRLLLIAFLLVHATVTELLQLGVARRSGNLHDVAYDHLGVLLGLAMSWKWWREGT